MIIVDWFFTSFSVLDLFFFFYIEFLVNWKSRGIFFPRRRVSVKRAGMRIIQVKFGRRKKWRGLCGEMMVEMVLGGLD